MGAPLKKSPPASPVVPVVARIRKVIIRAPGLSVDGNLRTAFEAIHGFLIDDGSPIGVRIDKPGVCSYLVPWGDVRALEYQPLPVEP